MYAALLQRCRRSHRMRPLASILQAASPSTREPSLSRGRMGLLVLGSWFTPAGSGSPTRRRRERLRGGACATTASAAASGLIGRGRPGSSCAELGRREEARGSPHCTRAPRPPACRSGRCGGSCRSRPCMPPSTVGRACPTTRPRTWTSSPSGRAPGPARRWPSVRAAYFKSQMAKLLKSR